MIFSEYPRALGRVALILLPALAGCSAGAPPAWRSMVRDLEATEPVRHNVSGDAGVARPPGDGTGPARPSDEPGGDLFAGDSVLYRDRLVAAVLDRSPTIEAARQGWREAVNRVPAATSLEDPMASWSTAPLSIGGERFGQTFEIGQRLPFFGKRGLAGRAAMAEAEAARGDYESARRAVALMAVMLYDRAFVIERAREINRAHARLLADLKESATARYVTGDAAQQDPLRAEVELAHIERELLVLDSEREIVRASLNGLLHRAPDAPLPPPPAALPRAGSRFERNGDAAREAPAAGAGFIAEALAENPEIASARAMERSREARLRLARSDRRPDFGVMTSWSSMWPMDDHRWMVGLSLNIPLQTGRRSAAIAEADAALNRARRETEERADRVAVDVHRNLRRVREAEQVLDLHENRLLPAAADQVEAARAGFVTGRNSFTTLIDAVRGLRTLELDLWKAESDLFTRQAELDYSLGRIPGLGGNGDQP